MKLSLTLPCICFTILSAGACLAQTSQHATTQKNIVVVPTEQEISKELAKSPESFIIKQEKTSTIEVNGRKVNTDINGVQSLAVPEEKKVPKKTK